MSARHRGDYEYTGKSCDSCRDAEVEQDEFEGHLCYNHLDDARQMAEADLRVKFAKENDEPA